MTKKKMHLIDKDLHVKDIHLVFIEFFQPDNEFILTSGNHFQFKTRLMLMFGGLALFIFTSLNRIPNVPEIAASLAVGYLAVELIIFMVYKFGAAANEKSVPGIFSFLGIMLLILLGLGIFI